MVQLLFDVFFTIYPTVFRIVTFPLEGLFFLLDTFTPYEVPAINYLTYVLFTCILPPVGIIFVSQLLYQILRGNFKLTVSNRQWWLLFGGLVLMSLAIQGLIYLFPESLLVTTLVGPPLGPIWIFTGLGGLGATFYYLLKLIVNVLLQHIELIYANRHIQRALLGGLLVSAVYPFLLVVVVLVELFINPMGNLGASQFFVINAAIKNTCFIDPERNNCPHQLEEIGYIEPQAYQQMINNNQVNYVFDPEKNLYTLVVRYGPTRAVVFDWRLVATHGVDLHEYDVAVLGQDRLINPPAYDGPWTFPEWDYTKASDR